MKRIATLIALLSLSLLVLAEEDVEATKAVEAVIASAQRTVAAKPLVRTAPSYPTLELNKGREAWVHVAYCVDETGAIQNVSILDSVGNERFDKAAIDTVRQWKYEPALQNGEPVWQSRNNVFISFAIEGGEPGASRQFVRSFRKLGRLLDEGKLEEADELFWTMYQTFELNLYELAKLWSQRVRYESKIGDLYKLDLALNRATASHGEWIDKQSYIHLLGVLARVELSLGKYHEARLSYDELIAQAGEGAKDVLELRPTFEKLQLMIDSDDVLQLTAEVRANGDCAYCKDSWHFTPVRNDFSLSNIKGTLKSIDMRCDNKQFESDAVELVEWHIPDSWGTCQIHVYGEPGTTFDVLMLPANIN